MPVKLLLQYLDVEDFDELLAYDKIEGVPYPWLQTGVQTAAWVNTQISKGKGVTPADYMPTRQTVSDEEAIGALKRAANRGNNR